MFEKGSRMPLFCYDAGMNLRKLRPLEYLLIFLVLSALTFCFNLFGFAYSSSEGFRKIGPFMGAVFVGYFWVKLAYGNSTRK